MIFEKTRPQLERADSLLPFGYAHGKPTTRLSRLRCASLRDASPNGEASVSETLTRTRTT
ncbi:hypothetical protein LC608_18225 [Nostoc sp. XA010]|uniref:hypothetical protein n=1 Tax=Nostoc sp. XA010 TaxID=2780407 RepID=UPI001E41B2FD|nr:hypothetical protein [Nostoc sp. XA010]MCC5658886.1 hypothetical protein [Nostoc sp. XA010]